MVNRRSFWYGIAAIIFLILPVSTQVSSQEPLLCAPGESDDVSIVIHCGLKLLQVWRNTTLIKEYPIETGKGGLGKTRGGDHRTPIGDYRITWMASRVSDKGRRIEHATSWCKGNQFARGKSGPPLEKLWSREYGGINATVMSVNYPNARNRAKGWTGSCIHIHATLKLINGDLTRSHGCIHMFPKHAIELYEMVESGTPVMILP